MAHNVQMPRFAAAGNAPVSESWYDVDGLDVDLLAEYLLDDGNVTTSGAVFDFRYV